MSHIALFIAWVLVALIGMAVGTLCGAVIMARRLDGGSIGVQKIAAERKGQKGKGYTLDHDRLHMAMHGVGHLAGAGVAYGLRAIGNHTLADQLYTFADELPEQHPGVDGDPGPLHDLAVAGALIAAEIDLQLAVSEDFAGRQKKEPTSAD